MGKSDLTTLTKTEAIDLAGRMRNKARNIKINAEARTTKIGMLLIGGVGAFVAGQWMGGLRHERQAMTDEQIEAEGDPTQFLGMDKDALLGLAVSGIGMAFGKTRAGRVVEKGGHGILMGWAYSRGEEMGVARATEAAA